MTALPTGRTQVFISYSHEDAPYLKQLQAQLKPYMRSGALVFWDDTKIQAGKIWREELDTAVRSARVAILLVSAAYLASDFIAEQELPALFAAAREEGMTMLSVIVSPCAFAATPLAAYQTINDPDQPASGMRKAERDALWVRTARLAQEALQAQTLAPSSAAASGNTAAPPPHVGTAQPGASGKYQAQFLGNVQGVAIGDHQQVTMHFGSGPEPAKQRVLVLFLAANPSSTPRLAIDEEFRAIEQKVRAAEHREALAFQTALAVRPDDLLQLLNQYRPQVVHFSGHGRGEALYLAGEDGQARKVSTRALQVLFTTLKGAIRLVFLNACYSREQAQALVETIGCVIGMKAGIGDRATRTFASAFYRAIGFGRSVQEAFDQGIASLLLEGIAQEHVPDLLVKDGVDACALVLIPGHSLEMANGAHRHYADGPGEGPEPALGISATQPFASLPMSSPPFWVYGFRE